MAKYLVKLKNKGVRYVSGTLNTDRNFTRKHGFGPRDIDTSWSPGNTLQGSFVRVEPGFWLKSQEDSDPKPSDNDLKTSAKEPIVNMGVKTQKITREIKEEAEKSKTFPKVLGKDVLSLGIIGNLVKVAKSSFIGLSRQFQARVDNDLETTIEKAREYVNILGDKANELYRSMMFASTATGDYKMYQSVYQKAQPDPLRIQKRDYLMSILGRKVDFPALITVTQRTRKEQKEVNQTALNYRLQILEAADANPEDIQRVKDQILAESKLEDQVYQTDHFILQGINRPNTEKFQVVETFGEPAIIFYDQRAKIYQFNGTLLNAENVLWRDEFFDAYNRYLRGTMVAENNYRMLLTFDEMMLEGALLNININQTADSPKGVSMSFQMYVEKETMLALDKIIVANSEAKNAVHTNTTSRK